MYYFYKIVCDDVPDYAYVGSTRSLRHRKCQHKSNCNNENRKEYNYKLYKTIRETGGWHNWRMVCIHQEECEDKRAAEIKEEELRVQLNANMNSRRCHRTEEERTEYNNEYYSENKDYYKDYYKQYYSENREKILEQYNKPFDCECGGRYTHKNKSRHERSKKHLKFINLNIINT